MYKPRNKSSMMMNIKATYKWNLLHSSRNVAILRHKSSTTIPRQIIDSDNIIRSPFSDVEIPVLNLSQYIWRNLPKKHLPALTCAVTGRSYTYGEARDASEKLSISLPAATGLKQGDTLGLVLPNMPEFPITTLAAAAVGIVVSPANPVYTPKEIARQMTDSGAKAVATTPDILSKVKQAVELMPGGAQILVVTDGGASEEAALKSQNSNVLSLHELIRQEHTKNMPRLPPADPYSIAVLPYSSGTTGLPKGVKISHHNLVANLCQMEHPDILPVKCPEGSQNVSLAVLPYYHIFGLTGVMAINLCFGRHTISLPKFESSLFAASVIRYKPSVISLVPPLLMYVAATDKLSSQDLSQLRSVVCGAAPATQPVIEKFIAKINNSEFDFREGFGMTETSCMALYNPRGIGMRKIGSCGHPVPMTEVKIADEDGKALPLGMEGELLVRGPQVMQGYHNNDEATKGTLTHDGWLKTGDVAIVDDEGFIFIVDRMKELIKVNGMQVSPTEVEGVIRQMNGISDVAVVGIPDDRAGELPRAYIVPLANHSISEKEIFQFVDARVAPFKRLAGGIRFIEEIPKTASGKILRKILKQMP